MNPPPPPARPVGEDGNGDEAPSADHRSRIASFFSREPSLSTTAEDPGATRLDVPTLCPSVGSLAVPVVAILVALVVIGLTLSYWFIVLPILALVLVAWWLLRLREERGLSTVERRALREGRAQRRRERLDKWQADAGRHQEEKQTKRIQRGTARNTKISEVGRRTSDAGLACPRCGGAAFKARRSAKARVGVVATGVAGALVTRQRRQQVQCVSCGARYKGEALRQVPALAAAARPPPSRANERQRSDAGRPLGDRCTLIDLTPREEGQDDRQSARRPPSRCLTAQRAIPRPSGVGNLMEGRDHGSRRRCSTASSPLC